MTKLYRKMSTIRTELPVIPNYVAEYIDYMKSTDCDILDAIHYPFKSNKVDKYIEDDSETFARAWLDGFQTEESYGD